MKKFSIFNFQFSKKYRVSSTQARVLGTRNSELGTNSGFTLVETIMYLLLLVLLLAVVIGLILSLSKTYKVIQATKNIETSAVFSLERMTRDIRSATSVTTGQSTLGTNPGVLTLNSTDSSGAALTIKYYLSNNVIKVDENGSYVGPLTLSGVTVSNLIFRLSTSTNSQAVKVEMTLQSSSGSATTTSDFNTTVELRGSL